MKNQYTATKNHNQYDSYYHSNYDDESKSGQIKRVKSIQQIPKMEFNKRDRSKQSIKKTFIEPGTQCQFFQQIISNTKIVQNGMTTYLTAKALRGPSLAYASQLQFKKKNPKKPTKPLPQIPNSITGGLQPHLIGYSTITHQGLYRETNDDKITIYLEDNAKWFSLYDGHGGSKCSQFLKQHLHQQFFGLDWKKDIPTALRQAFYNAQMKWQKKGDNSGSCALVIFIYQNTCYAANLGDSRAILSSQQNTKCYQITKDHKPSNVEEQKRVMESGGKIYQTTAITEASDGTCDMIIGPLRVFPGRLSITRTFGDAQAKNSKDGNPNVVICEPEITSFQIDDHDLIIMGSDGIWDKIQNVQTVEIMKNFHGKQKKWEQIIGKGAETILQQSMKRGSTDNVSLIVIGLNDPDTPKQPKKGNQHIKIMSSINQIKKKVNNKQNNNPDKLKQIDSRIQQINQNATRILQQSRR